jgi:hypothetical protein
MRIELSRQLNRLKNDTLQLESKQLSDFTRFCEPYFHIMRHLIGDHL